MVCPVCRTPNDHPGRYCIGCGHALQDMSQAGTSPAPSSYSTVPAASVTTPFPPPSPAPWPGEPSPSAARASAEAIPLGAPGDGHPLLRMGVMDALLLPLRQPDIAMQASIASVLNMLPLVGVVWVAGYLLRWRRRLFLGGSSQALPTWTDWWSLFVDGMWGTTIASVFCLVPALITLGWWLQRVFDVVGSGSVSEDSIWGLLSGALLGVLLTLACSLPAPLATCHYVRSGRVWESLQPSAWLPVMLHGLGEYLLLWLQLALAGCVVAFVAMSALSVPLLGPLISFVISFVGPVLLWMGSTVAFTRYYLRHVGARGA